MSRNKIKKRYVVLLIILSPGIFLIHDLLSTRDMQEMEDIARSEVNWALFDHGLKDLVDEFKGPLIMEETEQYVTFFWYKELQWGDSAKIRTKIFRSFSSIDRKQAWWKNYYDYSNPSAFLNDQASYLYPPKRDFDDAFPQSTSGFKFLPASELTDYDLVEDDYDFTISLDLLERVLIEGYFYVTCDFRDTAFVSFHEPIAKVYANDGKDTIWSESAKFVNCSTGKCIVVPIARGVECEGTTR